MYKNTLLIQSNSLHLVVECEDVQHATNVLNSSVSMLKNIFTGEGDESCIQGAVNHMKNLLNQELPAPYTDSIRMNLGYDVLSFQYTRDNVYIDNKGDVRQGHSHNTYKLASNRSEFIFLGTDSPTNGNIINLKPEGPNDFIFSICRNMDPYPFLKLLRQEWPMRNGNGVEEKCNSVKEMLLDKYRESPQEFNPTIINTKSAIEILKREEGENNGSQQ